MKIIISAMLAYLLSSIWQIMNDLDTPILERPMWAIRPTIGNAILVGLTWFIRPIQTNFHNSKQLARAIAFGLLIVVMQMFVLTGFIWCCIKLSTYIFDSTILQIVTTAILLIIIGNLPIIRLIVILTWPLTLIFALPMDLLFPRKEKINSQDDEYRGLANNGKVDSGDQGHSSENNKIK